MAELEASAPAAGLFLRARRRVVHELAALERDAQSERARVGDAQANASAQITLLVAGLCLVLMEYLAGPRALATLVDALHELSPALPDWYELRASRWQSLCDLTLWVTTRALGFVVVPGLVIHFWLRMPMRSFGLSWPTRAHLLPYLGLFALVLPLLVLASLRPEFRAYYPFYRRAGDSLFDLLFWEALYAFQFFCVEFFFRGFLLTGSFARLGSLSVFAAMLPYCMVHFTKPVLEVLGAIPAGIVLGVLALRTGSIWGGVLLHVAVAWTMDALALAQGAGLRVQLWP